MWWKLWRRHWQGLLIEMVAVFIGVSAAFALDSYREHQEKAERRQQVVELLLKDVIDAEKRLEETLKWVNESPMYGQFLEKLDAKQMPPLKFFALPDFNSTQIWITMLQSGGAAVIDVELLRDVENLIVMNDAWIAQNLQFNELNRTMLLPNLEQPPAHFYDPDTAMLRPKYGWYPYYLRTSLQMTKQVQALLPTLKIKLEEQLQR